MPGRTKLVLFIILLIVTDLQAQSSKARLRPLHDTSSFGRDIENYYKLLQLPALAVGVALGDSLIFFRGMGAANALTKEPVTADHIFPIASVTKTFTAVALKQMEGEGKLSLEDPVSKFPNQYFTPDRWSQRTTLGQLLSNTAESSPPGTRFIYNGSKFNIVFNAFAAINKTRVPNDIARPFTEEIQGRILTPLKMEHTLLRFSESEHGYLRKWFAQIYRLDNTEGRFIPVDFNPVILQSGPGFGMMSSVNDLVRYSSALSRDKLLTALQYRQLTSPFYPGSPYGAGWFTASFEGTEMHWAYGYGDNDAALLLRVPSKDLTLIMLSPCSLPSAATRLGYGNPFNAMLVCSFFRNYVQTELPNSRLPVEEKFARATTLAFLPASFHPDSFAVENLLQGMMKEFPSDTIWQTPTAFELVSASGNPQILEFGLQMAEEYARSGALHPVKAWYAGLIYQKNGKPEKAAACFERLARGDAYREQSYKFNAMMALAKWYRDTDAQRCREVLEALIRFKGYINANDQQYKEAKEMLEGAKSQ
ncbi:serine hydrolase domain-containing protein [Chitinophaga japonensis]|uniref:CubicO group peptidase (Beta-lactamase class C family) n=1 Tax=Chitinophaga japonensis TaxID=104662 RepID=A0A562SRX2_CHIJA|nr:serine hydrolase domain-containing protein [Chitinophaga japonensis]TWI84009.1 CubicO group peptidase (beta-lactamase class C family) [Chitinophaga japonensis]